MKHAATWITCVLLTVAARAQDVQLAGTRWSVRIDPATLAVTAAVADEQLVIADAAADPRTVTGLQQAPRKASWRLPGYAVDAALDGAADDLLVELTATEPGTFRWPSLAAPGPDALAYIVPFFEGSYVPVRDREWAEFLERQGAVDTTAGLCMPFWAVQTRRHTVTYALTNAFNNELTFTRHGDALGWSFAHEFTRNHPVKQYGLRIHLGGPSPIEPALFYRDRLKAEGGFLSLRDKIDRTPDAGKLLGAAHVYLWGDDVLARDDVTDYRRLVARLVAAEGDAAKRLWSKLTDEQRKHLTAVREQAWVSEFDKGQVVAALSEVGREDLPLVTAAVGDLLKPPDQWGDGFAPRLLDALARAGLDRLWLGSPSWRGLTVRPAAVARARELGYLVAPYDSYHSIHPPGEADTWETAQFDAALLALGPIVKPDGSRRAGFKHKGFLLSPLASRPYVERRVDALADAFHANAWFVDCDGFGDWFDDYAPAHPATAADDLAARRSRLDWMRDAHHLVVGTEGGSALVTPSIVYAHGVMTPGIGWGDPDLTRKDSKYFLGGYYPPDEPAVFFKTVPLKPQYARFYTDPAFRLPLYEVVFHDAVVATHQWGYGSLKFEDPAHARELLELLYQVPPLYHLNLRAWKQRQAEIAAHYGFFSPLHRETATLPMTAFEFLDEGRTVQRTVFGDGAVELIANFSAAPVAVGGLTVPAASIVARRKDGQTRAFTPGG